MKRNGSWPLVLGLLLLLAVNALGFWRNAIGPDDFLLSLPLIFFFFLMVCVAFLQMIFILYERFRDKGRIITTVLLISCLVLIFLFPTGLIARTSLNGKVLLQAYREGAANCTTTLSLMEDLSFTERQICFGTKMVTGRYKLQNDTVFFSDIELGRGVTEYYDFAIIHKNERFVGDEGEIIRYDHGADSGATLWIVLDDLTIKGQP